MILHENSIDMKNRAQCLCDNYYVPIFLCSINCNFHLIKIIAIATTTPRRTIQQPSFFLSIFTTTFVPWRICSLFSEMRIPPTKKLVTKCRVRLFVHCQSILCANLIIFFVKQYIFIVRHYIKGYNYSLKTVVKCLNLWINAFFSCKAHIYSSFSQCNT